MLGQVKQTLKGLVMLAERVSLNFEETINPILGSIRISVCLQAFSGVCLLYFAIKLLQRRWQIRSARTRRDVIERNDINCEGYECTICIVNPRNIVYFPCKHLAICEVISKQACDVAMDKCPVCRTRIACRIKLHFIRYQ